MFKRIKNSILNFFREETFKERSQRMLPGALLGLLAGTAYVLVLSTINVLTLPALHLSLDWIRLLTNLVKYDLILALVGALAGWFTDDLPGAVGGGIVTILIYLAYNLIVFRIQGANPSQVVQLFVTALPLLVAAALLCWAFRFAIGRYLRITHPQPNQKPQGRMAGLIVLVIIVGMLPGLLSRFDQNSQNVILTMQQRLQAVASDPSLENQFPLAQFPDLKAHFGKPFMLYPRASASVPNSLDVTIRYADGYALTCRVSTTDPYVQYFAQCSPGNNVKLP
jgi:hypothetical protein